MSIVERFTFMAGSLPRTPFKVMVRAASQAGFDSMTLWPNIWRYAMKKEGLTLKDMRAMLDDHGLALADLDACQDWAPPQSVSASSGQMKGGTARDEFFEVCSQLGGATVVAAYMTDVPLNLDRDVAGFARLCDDAARHGLRIALEFIPFTHIPDAATAWKIVSGANRSNGGLVADIWHHVRSGSDDAGLCSIPAEKIYTVQLSDGPAQASADLMNETVYGRLLPGEGSFNTVGFLRLLEEMGVRASVGPESYSQSFESRDPVEVIQQLADATRLALARASV